MTRSELQARIDAVGSSWTVLGDIGPRPGRGSTVYATCRCQCGCISTVSVSNMTSGKSLRCFRCGREAARTNGGAAADHPKAYSVWLTMIARCHKPGASGYETYGARGIYVCARWRESVHNFIADMGDPPSGMSIDRIDNDGPYSPENCRWATNDVQCRNRRTNRMMTLDGRTQCLSDWARELGIKQVTLSARLRNGWSHERALTTPLRGS